MGVEFVTAKGAAKAWANPSCGDTVIALEQQATHHIDRCGPTRLSFSSTRSRPANRETGRHTLDASIRPACLTRLADRLKRSCTVEPMGVELTFAMTTDSSASMRVQSMLLPFDERFENRWVETGDRTLLVIRVPEAGVQGFIDDVHACHPTIRQVGEDAIDLPTDLGSSSATR